MSYNKAIYSHTHYSNGRIITHAHPYNKSDKSSRPISHQHSDYQYFQLDNLNTFSFADNLQTQKNLQAFEIKTDLPIIVIYNSDQHSDFLYRGPPSRIS